VFGTTPWGWGERKMQTSNRNGIVRDREGMFLFIGLTILSLTRVATDELDEGREGGLEND